MSYQDVDEIIKHLYISNWYSSINPVELKKHNIKAIITIETRQKTQDILNYYRKNDIDYLFLYLNDLPSENISKYFNISYNFIDKHIKQGNNVLVNCWAGISRSSTIILNYLMRKYYETGGKNQCSNCVFKYFLNHCQSKRPIINPNEGFKSALISYYKKD
jgi:hypothetical protein